MSKPYSMEEHCHCSHEAEYDHDWSDVDPGRQYVAYPLVHGEALGCTYFWMGRSREHPMEKRH